MSTITLPNIRVGSDLQIRVRLKDGGVAIDWSTLQNIKACIYSDAQRALAGRCAFSIDEEDNTLLVCTYAANKPQYLGVNRIVISAKYMGETKTYDKPAFSFVRWTADQEGEEITIDDPDVDVEITVEDVSSSILQEAVDAAFTAADRANEAAEAAEHMVDIHTGPEGKSAYEVAVEEGYTGTEEEWLASLKGDTGETPDISIGTVTTVAPGTPASASMTGTPEEPVLNLSIPQGVVGATPNFTVGTVTTGEPGSSVIVTITGTPEAPVLNLTIPQGMQGNTGSSVEFPYELVNNLTTNDATKGLSAAQGVVLDGKVSQLEAKVTDLEDAVDGIDALKDITDETVPPSSSYDTTQNAQSYPEAAYNSLIFATAIDTESTITGIKLRVYKQTGATYKAKLITTETTGNLKITSLKEFDLEEPTDTFKDEEITFDTPFNVSAGCYVGIEADSLGVIRTASTLTPLDSVFVRSVTYANQTVGANVWPYAPSSSQRHIAIELLNKSATFKTFADENYVDEKIAESELRTDAKIEQEDKELRALFVNGYPLVWVAGNWYHGEISPSQKSLCLKNPIPVKKGQRLFSSKNFKVTREEDGVYTDISETVYEYIVPEDMFIVVSVNFYSSSQGNITEDFVDMVNSGLTVLSIEDYDVRDTYSRKQNEIFNFISVRDGLNLTTDEQLMTHVASCEYDPYLGTFWLVYYANNSVTVENSDDVRTYVTLVNFNPYTKEFKRVELLKANETKGGFTQGNMPPYDPTIGKIGENTVTVIFECYDTQHGIATATVNKSDFFNAAEGGTQSELSGLPVCPVTSIVKNKLTYNDVQYDMDCTGMKAMYEAYKGSPIGTISDLCISMKPYLYNGLYYATVQDIFNGSGLMPVLMSTSDLVNWSFVKVFDEMTWDTFAETSLVIKDDIVYLSGRPTASATTVELYNLSTGEIVCQPYNVPLALSCKTAMAIFNGRVILVSQFPCYYGSAQGRGNFRKNFGVWEMTPNGASELLCVIISQDGLNYPDFVQAKEELFLLASNDKRYLNRNSQRTSIGFAKILV